MSRESLIESIKKYIKKYNKEYSMLTPAYCYKRTALSWEDAHCRLRSRSGVGDACGRVKARGADCRASHFGDDNVPVVCQVDSQLARLAAETESVEQRSAVGVQTPAAVPANARVPVAGGLHGFLKQRGGNDWGILLRVIIYLYIY